jgi:hypothetical protein
MKRAVIVATLLLQVAGFATATGAAQSVSSSQCEWWYLGALRYVMPLAIVLDTVGSKQCQWQCGGVPGTATLEKALDRTPHQQ